MSVSGPAAPAATTRPATAARWTAALLAFEALLIFVPLVILGAAIEWPASLDDPASVALPRLLENESAVRAGYIVYLAYSALFLPVAVLATRALTRRDDGDVWVRLALGFAVASTLARCIGILRWLTAMPALAEAYVAAPDDATRASLAAQYNLLNDFGGGIGELLGVSLFAVLWLAATVVAAWRSDTPRWLLAFGAFVALLLAAPLVELGGGDAGPLVTVGASALHFWLLAAAFVIARRSSKGVQS
jgi:hypothetical protein